MSQGENPSKRRGTGRQSIEQSSSVSSLVARQNDAPAPDRGQSVPASPSENRLQSTVAAQQPRSSLTQTPRQNVGPTQTPRQNVGPTQTPRQGVGPTQTPRQNVTGGDMRKRNVMVDSSLVSKTVGQKPRSSLKQGSFEGKLSVSFSSEPEERPYYFPLLQDQPSRGSTASIKDYSSSSLEVNRRGSGTSEVSADHPAPKASQEAVVSPSKALVPSSGGASSRVGGEPPVGIGRSGGNRGRGGPVPPRGQPKPLPRAPPTNPEARSMFHSHLFPFAESLAPDSRRPSVADSLFGDRAERRRSSAVEAHQTFVRSLGSGRMLFIFIATCMFTTILAFKMHFQSIINHLSQRGIKEFRTIPLDVPQARGLWLSKQCPSKDRQRPWNGPFDWSATEKRQLLRYYFCGYMSSPILSAILADQLSAKWVVFFALMINVFCAIATPWFAAFGGWEWVAFIFLTQGVGGGAFMPAITTMISFWAPPMQRSTFTGFIFGGVGLAKAFAAGISYAIWNTPYHYLFHFGVLACVPPLLMWGLWMESKPSESVFIRLTERLYIDASHAGTRVEERNFPFPYGDLMASGPFWVLFVFHFVTNCLLVMVVFQVPAYMEHVLFLDIEENLVYAIVPYLLMFIVSFTSGLAIDSWVRKDMEYLPKCRKIAAIVAILIPAIFLMAVPSAECNEIITFLLFGIAVAGCGVQPVSVLTNHLDISPNFAGYIMAITDTFATVPFLVIPMAMSSVLGITSPEHYAATYALFFYIVSICAVMGLVLFIIFGSTDIEPWNEEIVIN